MKSKKQKRRWNKVKRQARRAGRYFHLVLPKFQRAEFLKSRDMLEESGAYSVDLGKKMVARMLEESRGKQHAIQTKRRT